MFKLLLGGAGTLQLQEYFPAGFVLRVGGVSLTLAQIVIFARFCARFEARRLTHSSAIRPSRTPTPLCARLPHRSRHQ